MHAFSEGISETWINMVGATPEEILVLQPQGSTLVVDVTEI